MNVTRNPTKAEVLALIKSGQVTKEERQAARQAMREHWRNKATGADTPATPAN